MNHFPEEIQEKGQKANTQLRYFKNPLFRNEFLPRMQENNFPKCEPLLANLKAPSLKN
jgi:hypothetical protein